MTDSTFSQVYTVLSCHSLEDFPVHFEGQPANELLVSWCGPWHPQLVAASREGPRWCSTMDLPEIDGSRVDRASFVVPTFLADHEKELVADTYSSEKKDDASDEASSPAVEVPCRIVPGHDQLDALAEALLGTQPAPLNQELVRDFYALGYWYLQIQLLTRRMHLSLIHI